MIYCPDVAKLVPYAIVFLLFVVISLLLIGILFVTRISRKVQVIIDNVETTVEEIGF